VCLESSSRGRSSQPPARTPRYTSRARAFVAGGGGGRRFGLNLNGSGAGGAGGRLRAPPAAWWLRGVLRAPQPQEGTRSHPPGIRGVRPPLAPLRPAGGEGPGIGLNSDGSGAEGAGGRLRVSPHRCTVAERGAQSSPATGGAPSHPPGIHGVRPPSPARTSAPRWGPDWAQLEWKRGGGSGRQVESPSPLHGGEEGCSEPLSHGGSSQPPARSPRCTSPVPCARLCAPRWGPGIGLNSDGSGAGGAGGRLRAPPAARWLRGVPRAPQPRWELAATR
jgi:hypothetical protein